jgi:hypothetical protein
MFSTRSVMSRLALLAGLSLLMLGVTSCSSPTSSDGGGGGSQPNTHALTIETVGQGSVSPVQGSHEYDRDALVELAAVPAEGWQFGGWVGAVADATSPQTTVTMDRDHTVYAVFMTEDMAPGGDGALTHLTFSGAEYAAEYEAWNCDGLQGLWQLRGVLDVDSGDVFGTLEGEGTFTMPPRPASGSWESAPSGWTMTGSIDADPATVEIVYDYSDMIITLIELVDGPTLLDARGHCTATVTVILPEGSFTLSEESFQVSFAPALVRFLRHAECD